MNIVCYACKQPFNVTGWNPFRQTVVCPQVGCGRHVHVGEAVERVDKVAGERVKKILGALEGIKSREDHSHLADYSLLKIESLVRDAEVGVTLEVKRQTLLTKIRHRLKAPTRTAPLDICEVRI